MFFDIIMYMHNKIPVYMYRGREGEGERGRKRGREGGREGGEMERERERETVFTV